MKKEIEDWKRAYTQLKQEKDREGDMYRQKIAQYEQELLKYKSASDRVNQLEDQISMLASELERWKNTASQRGEELQQLRS